MPRVSSRQRLSLSFHTGTDTVCRIVGKIVSEISEKLVQHILIESIFQQIPLLIIVDLNRRNKCIETLRLHLELISK